MWSSSVSVGLGLLSGRFQGEETGNNFGGRVQSSLMVISKCSDYSYLVLFSISFMWCIGMQGFRFLSRVVVCRAPELWLTLKPMGSSLSRAVVCRVSNPWICQGMRGCCEGGWPGTSIFSGKALFCFLNFLLIKYWYLYLIFIPVFSMDFLYDNINIK